jgi:hypothetical protein
LEARWPALASTIDSKHSFPFPLIRKAFHTRSQLKVGDTVALTFASLVEGEGEKKVQGRVVRVQKNETEMGYMWPFLVAVEFEHKSSDLEDTIAKATAVTGSVIA